MKTTTTMKSRTALLLLLLVELVGTVCAFSTWKQTTIRNASLVLKMVNSQREDEIRRKIMKLKRQGRIQKTTSDELQQQDDEYSEKIKAKLGMKKANMMGLTTTTEEEIQAELESYEEEEEERQLGSLPRKETNAVEKETTSKPIIDPSLFEEQDNVEEPNEEDLVELVAQKLQERQEEEEEDLRLSKLNTSSQQTTINTKNTNPKVETYQPKTGSWGAFPRPKDISKAYGGGRRVGAGFDASSSFETSQEDTRARLRQYREKVGIDVQSEKEYANEIEEALRIAGYAMQVSKIVV